MCCVFVSLFMAGTVGLPAGTITSESWYSSTVVGYTLHNKNDGEIKSLESLHR